MNDSLQGGVACLNCWNISETEHVNFDTCEKCESFLPRLGATSQTRLCEHCKNLLFIAARSCGSYKGAFREVILKLKTSPQIPDRLLKNLVEAFHRLPNAAQISMMIPVPLHRERLRERGFNQAEIMAEALSKALPLRTQNICVIREKATERHRAGMDFKKRQQIIKGAFTVRAPKLIYAKNILLLDDVMTSGSTANELAEALLDSGAASVSLLTVARASIFQ